MEGVEMSFKLMAEVFDVRVGSPIRKMVLLKLADQANDSGECYPSYETIASACELSRRSVITHIKWLEDNGYLRIERRYNHEAKKNFSNMYHLTISKVSNDRKTIVSGAGFSLGGSEGAALGSEGAALGGSKGAAPEPINIESINEPKKNRAIKSQTKKPAVKKEIYDAFTHPIPFFIEQEDWIGFVEMRVATKKPMTEKACKILVNKLTKWHEQGLDIQEAINQSTLRNYPDIYEPKTNLTAHNKKGINNGQSQAASTPISEADAYRQSLRGISDTSTLERVERSVN